MIAEAVEHLLQAAAVEADHHLVTDGDAEYYSNLRLAANLKGKLLLIHGTSDVNAPFSETMKMVEALIRAGKPYDLIVMPEQSHGSLRVGTSGTYWRDALRRYFQEHLKP